MASLIRLILSSVSTSFVKVFISLPFPFILGTILYRLMFNPLAKIPGPRLWAVSRLPSFYYLAIGRLHSRLRELHEEYGPVLRVAPGEISFITESSWSDIYLKPVGKPQLQKALARYAPIEESGLVLQANDEVHSRIRLEPTMIKYLDQFISCLRERSNKPVDIVDWYTFLQLDILGELVFGESCDSLEKGSTSEWARDMVLYLELIILRDVIKKFRPFHHILDRLIPDFVKIGAASLNRATREKLARRLGKADPQPDMITPLIKTLNTPIGVTSTELLATIRQLFIAGTESTTAALSAMTYLLCENRIVLARLTIEIRTSFPTSAAITKNTVATLPYLNAALNELLRIFPSVPGNLRRVTPPEGCIISGIFVPGNTIVSHAPWANGLSSSNFARAQEFLPERYLADFTEFETDKRNGHQPFSIGPRNCIAKNFALVEMRLVVSRLLWEFDLELQTESRGWIGRLRAYGVFQKPPLMVRLKSVWSTQAVTTNGAYANRLFTEPKTC